MNPTNPEPWYTWSEQDWLQFLNPKVEWTPDGGTLLCKECGGGIISSYREANVILARARDHWLLDHAGLLPGPGSPQQSHPPRQQPHSVTAVWPVTRQDRKPAVAEAEAILHLSWPVLWHHRRGCRCQDCHAKFTATYQQFIQEFEAAEEKRSRRRRRDNSHAMR